MTSGKPVIRPAQKPRDSRALIECARQFLDAAEAARDVAKRYPDNPRLLRMMLAASETRYQALKAAMGDG